MVKEQTGYDLRRTSDESMMSKGATIRPWHYAPFLEALKRIAGIRVAPALNLFTLR